jgi:glycine cleavage system aminomethyltransferase T
MIRYRGHLNRKLVGLRLRGDPLPHPGDRILADGVEVGRTASAAFSFSLRTNIALGYVKCAWGDPGTRLVVRTKEGEVEADVCALPFVARGEASICP